MGNSAIGRGTAVEEQKVKASSGDGSPGYLDGKVDGDTMVVTANELVSVNEFYVGTFSRDTTIASGNQAITGVGFQPKAVVFLMCEAASTEMSVGFDDGSSGASLRDRSIASAGANVWYSTGSLSIYDSQGAGVNEYRGAITSMDSDGFTFAWVRDAAPTGTIDIQFLALK